MRLQRSRLLTLSVLLPMAALGAFTLAPPLHAQCDPGPNVCCSGGEVYAVGQCESSGCWFWSSKKCESSPGGYAYFSQCGGC
jgi:hypothetical protein